MNFNDMSIKALRTYAKENKIKLQSATKKADIVAILEEATGETVQEPNAFEDFIADSSSNSDAVVGSRAEDARAAREEQEKIERVMATEVDPRTPTRKDSRVCVYSTRKYSSSQLGKLDLGYNIVKRELAELWIRLPDVRPASEAELQQAMAAGIKPGQLVRGGKR
jgi:hypothetical protein